MCYLKWDEVVLEDAAVVSQSHSRIQSVQISGSIQLSQVGTGNDHVSYNVRYRDSNMMKDAQPTRIPMPLVCCS